MKFVWLGSALAAVMAIPTVQVGQAPEEVVQLKCKVGETDVAVIGVCSFNDESVQCWDPSGHRDEQLTSEVRTGLAKADHVPSFPIASDRKNRLIVVDSRVPRSGGSYVPMQGSLVPGSPNWSYRLKTVIVTEGEKSNSRTIDLIGVSCGPDQLIGSIYLKEPKYYRSSTRLEPEVGSTCTLDQWTLSLVGFKPDPKPAKGQPPQPVKTWTMTLKVTGPLPVPTLRAQAEDKSAKLIARVDKDGRPVTYDFEAQRKMSIDERLKVERLQAGDMYFRWGDKDVIGLVCHIDPRFIGGMVVTGVRERTVEVTGFALDPKD